MDNELVKKVYEHFGGVWPYANHTSMIISTKSNTVWGEGKYQPWDKGENEFNSLMKGGEGWEWVGTKAEFEACGESPKQELKVDKNAPEGATHFFIDYYKEGHHYMPLTGEWLDNDLVNKEVLGKMTPLKTPQKRQDKDWLPEVGQECEYMPEAGEKYEARDIGVTLSETTWRECFFVGITSKGNYLVEWLDNGEFNEYSVIRFRAIKTELERFQDRIKNLVDASKSLQSAKPNEINSFIEVLWQEGVRFND